MYTSAGLLDLHRRDAREPRETPGTLRGVLGGGAVPRNRGVRPSDPPPPAPPRDRRRAVLVRRPPGPDARGRGRCGPRVGRGGAGVLRPRGRGDARVLEAASDEDLATPREVTTWGGRRRSASPPRTSSCARRRTSTSIRGRSPPCAGSSAAPTRGSWELSSRARCLSLAHPHIGRAAGSAASPGRVPTDGNRGAGATLAPAPEPATRRRAVATGCVAFEPGSPRAGPFRERPRPRRPRARGETTRSGRSALVAGEEDSRGSVRLGAAWHGRIAPGPDQGDRAEAMACGAVDRATCIPRAAA